MRAFLLLIACVIINFHLYAQPLPYHSGPGWSYYGPLDYTAFGWSMTTAGDVNGDGYEDMIVSAIDYSNPIETEEEEGRLFLFYGGPDGLSDTPAWSYESNQTTTVLGFSTSGGDVNGDGYSDIVAGGLQWSGMFADEGKVYLWYGGPSGPSAGDPDWSLTMGQAGALFGSGAALDGDLNGDGFNDLLVSAKMWDEPEQEEGKVWLYWGSADGPVFSGWTWQPDQEGAIAGFPINYAGDVNGDGYADVVIGVNGYDYFQQDDGLIAVFYGGPGMPSSTPDWMASGGQKKCNFGHWTDGAGDVNGDGYDDIIASALLYESELAEGSEGRVFVFHGGPEGPSDTANWFGEVNQLQAQLGYSCAGAGDINGDGFDDVIGGAKYWDDGNADEGGAFVWFGGPDGIQSDYCWSAGGDQDSAYYGRHVGGACDFNLDGYADFMVGAYRYTEVLEADGKGFVYYGAPRPADFAYPANTFCLEAEDPVPTILGTPGGTFASADAIVDPVTGAINLMASGAGHFSITYTIPGNCPVTAHVTIEDPSLTTWFAYARDTFCVEHADLTPVIIEGATGIFSATGITLDPLTGIITADSAMAGTHTIYFTGETIYGCSIFDSTVITLLPAAIVEFEQDVFCQTDSLATAVVNITGGTFSSDLLTINAVTGVVELFSTASGGPYIITYTTYPFCPVAQTTITIDSANHALASFAYGDDSLCTNEAGLFPVLLPAAGDGVYASDGASVDPLTGFINPGATLPGIYSITYTANNGACVISDTVMITVIEGVDPYFSYAADTYLLGEANPTPDVTDPTGYFFSIPDGLILDSLSGEIDLLLSDTGTYVIYYTVENVFCSDSYTDTIHILPACVPPTFLEVLSVTATTAWLAWTPAAEYDNARIRLLPPDGSVEEVTCSCSSYIFEGLIPDTTYGFTVSTVCAGIAEAESDSLSFKTEKEVGIGSLGPEDVQIYPNPVDQLLYVHVPTGVNTDMCIYDMWGSQILCRQVRSDGAVDMRSLDAGVYYVQLGNNFHTIVKL